MKRKSNSILDDFDFCIPPELVQASEYANGNSSEAYVHIYSRAEALKDGVLMDASDIAKDLGFICPVAFTLAAWDATVDGAHFGFIGSIEGRVIDVLRMLRITAKRGSNSVDFLVVISLEDGNLRRVFLRATCGAGDDEQPVITIMLPNED